jgi:predicted Fe-Mo cluster-binding NifX family protein
VSTICRSLVSLLICLPLAGFFQFAAAEDKFAIAADGDQPTAQVAKLAGIAPFFHLCDANGELLEVFPNPHLKMEYGIGPAAATTLADMGPKMEEVLTARQIRIVRRLGTVEEVINELKE